MSSLSAAVVPTSAAATVAIAIASAFIYRQFTQPGSTVYGNFFG